MSKRKGINKWFFSSVMLPLAERGDQNALSSFAITMAIAFPVVFMLVLPYVFSTHIPNWPIYMSLGLTFLYFFAPKILYYPYLVWMVIASILGFINTRIILAIAYYLLIVPTGLVMQWRKGLEYKHQIHDPSVWSKREQSPTKKNLKDPF